MIVYSHAFFYKGLKPHWTPPKYNNYHLSLTITNLTFERLTTSLPIFVLSTLIVKIQCERDDASFMGVSHMTRFVSPIKSRFKPCEILRLKQTLKYLTLHVALYGLNHFQIQSVLNIWDYEWHLRLWVNLSFVLYGKCWKSEQLYLPIHIIHHCNLKNKRITNKEKQKVINLRNRTNKKTFYSMFVCFWMLFHDCLNLRQIFEFFQIIAFIIQ